MSPTTNREATKIAIDKLQVIKRTAIGESIFTALQTIATVGAVIGGGDTPPPARIVLLSDGEENKPTNPDAPVVRLPPPEPPRIRVCRFQRSRSGRPTGTSISTTSIFRCQSPARR